MKCYSKVDRAFYEEEGIFDEYTMKKLALMENAELSSLEKSTAIALLEDTLPFSVQQQIAYRYSVFGLICSKASAMNAVRMFNCCHTFITVQTTAFEIGIFSSF